MDKARQLLLPTLPGQKKNSFPCSNCLYWKFSSYQVHPSMYKVCIPLRNHNSSMSRISSLKSELRLYNLSSL